MIKITNKISFYGKYFSNSKGNIKLIGTLTFPILEFMLLSNDGVRGYQMLRHLR